MSLLEKCFDQLEKNEQEDNRIYGARRNQIICEIERQQYREAHTDSNGDWCSRVPD